MKTIFVMLFCSLVIVGCSTAKSGEVLNYPENTVLGLTPGMILNYPDCTSNLDTNVRCIDRDLSSARQVAIMIPEEENPFPFKIFRVLFPMYVDSIVILTPLPDVSKLSPQEAYYAYPDYEKSILEYYESIYGEKVGRYFETNYYNITFGSSDRYGVPVYIVTYLFKEVTSPK